MKHILSFLALLLLCSTQLSAQKLKGNASYYADRFHGRPTSTGETYNKNKYTAASKELPAGTVVDVTNIANGQTTRVRINDCGPHHPNRIIDLSRAAAEQIGLLRAGVAVVQLKIISMGQDGPTCNRSQANIKPNKPQTTKPKPVTVPAAKETPAKDPNSSLPTGSDTVFKLYGIQIAAYGKAENALDFIKKSKKKYGTLFTRTDTKLTRIFVGPFLTKKAAEKQRGLLKRKKIDGIVRRVQ